jgi:hypothetical protein
VVTLTDEERQTLLRWARVITWNNDPWPFVWTKTADEILERLTGYLNRTNGPAH